MPNLIDEEKENKVGTKVDTSVYQPKDKKKKSSKWWWPFIILIIVIIFIGFGFFSKIVMAVNSTNSNTGKKVNLFEQIKNLIINPEDYLQGEEEDRINILLAGIGGSGHQGAYLADTIIVVSIKPSTNEVATISIPRDLYVEIGDYGWRKINNALAFGYMNDYPGGGEILLAETIEKVLDIPIHYYARIDFEGFRKAIDDVSGIDVFVENSFTDYSYPDYSYGYQTISFTQGWEHMGGERALQYARSRKGNNGEGSDFARSRRQQKVLVALRDKFVSINTIINPNKILTTLNHLGDHNETNMQIWEMAELGKIIKDIQPDNIINQVLDTGSNGLLVSSTTIDGAYILSPASGDFNEIQTLVKNIFQTNFIKKENARIEIQNSTKTAGLASATSEKLLTMNYNVIGIGNADVEEPLAQTTIFDLSNGGKPHTIVNLKDFFKADLSNSLPAFYTEDRYTYEDLISPSINKNINASAEEAEILIVLGSDFVNTNTLTNSY
ncbi:MAG: LCP family protein [bacterium]|nr:LCP family protein [bacterium]